MPRIVKNYTEGPAGDNTTTLTVSNVTVYGQNRALVVCVYGYKSTGGVVPDSVVWNGHNLTNSVQNNTSDDAWGNASIWYLEAPEQVMDDVVITWPSNHLHRSAQVFLLNDAVQSSIDDGTGSASGTSPNPYIEVGTDGSLAIQATLLITNSGYSLVSFNYSSGQTEITNTNSTICTSGAYESIPTAGGYTQSVSFTTDPATGGVDEACSVITAFKHLAGSTAQGQVIFFE